MKRFVLFILCIVLVLSMCACGTQKPEENVEADSTPVPTAEVTGGETEAAQLVEYGEPVIYQWVELKEAEPMFEIVVPVKNISDGYVYFRGCTYTLKDKDGSEVGVFESADAAPMYLAPGQEGIIYYAAINSSGIDYLNPELTLEFDAEPITVDWEVIELEVSDITFSKNLGSTEICGTLTNNTDSEFSFPAISILFYDKDGNVLCGANGSGGVKEAGAEDYGVLHANTSCAFSTLRYWMPNDYPLEDVTVKAFAFGTPD